MKRDTNFLRTEYFKALIPIMLSVLGGTINALIDSVMVSLKLGSDGLAAVNLSMPVYLLLCVLGSLIAYGASILSSQAAGREDMKSSVRFFHTAVTLTLAAGIICMVAGYFANPALAVFLSRGEISLIPYVLDYCRVTFLGALPFIFSYLIVNYLQLEGKMNCIMNMAVMMVVLDLVLDILFLFPLQMGMTGLALASVISTLAACIYGWIRLQQGVSNYKFRLKQMGVQGTVQVLRFGSSSALRNLFDTVKLLFVNLMIVEAAGPQGAAMWAALNIFLELSMMITTGVPRAGLPMIGVYSAARENSGIRILLKLEVKTGLVLSAGYAVLLLALSVPLRNVFSLADSMFFPLLCLGICVILSLFGSILELFFNVTGRNILSNVQGGLRQFLFPVLALWYLIQVNGNPWLFLPLGVAAALLAVILLDYIIAKVTEKKGIPLSGVLLLDDSLEREQRVLDFSLPADMEKVCEASERISEFCELHEMDQKQVMRLGLSIEELLSVLIQKNPELRYVDLRAFVLQGVIGIRIRSSGKYYNPFEDEDSDEDFLMGISMLKKMSKVATHSYTLGMNTINILY